MEKPPASGGCRWLHFYKYYDTCTPLEFERSDVYKLDDEYKNIKLTFKFFLGPNIQPA